MGFLSWFSALEWLSDLINDDSPKRKDSDGTQIPDADKNYELAVECKEKKEYKEAIDLAERAKHIYKNFNLNDQINKCNRLVDECEDLIEYELGTSLMSDGADYWDNEEYDKAISSYNSAERHFRDGGFYSEADYCNRCSFKCSRLADEAREQLITDQINSAEEYIALGQFDKAREQIDLVYDYDSSNLCSYMYGKISEAEAAAEYDDDEENDDDDDEEYEK